MKRYLMNSSFFGTSIQIIDIEDSEKYYTRIYLDPKVGNGYQIEVSKEHHPPDNYNGKGFVDIQITDFAKVIDNTILRYLAIPSSIEWGEKLTFHINGSQIECISWENGKGKVILSIETTCLGDFKLAYKTEIIKYIGRKSVTGQVSRGVFKVELKNALTSIYSELKKLIIEAFD